MRYGGDFEVERVDDGNRKADDDRAGYCQGDDPERVIGKHP